MMRLVGAWVGLVAFGIDVERLRNAGADEIFGSRAALFSFAVSLLVGGTACLLGIWRRRIK